MQELTTRRDRPIGSKRVLECAQKIQDDIRDRSLKPGDRYLSAEEAGRRFGDSVMTAHRAMAILGRMKILDRRPKAGTFVGRGAATHATPCVHILIPGVFAVEGSTHQGIWDQICGIRSVLPDVAIQLNFIPQQDVAFAQQIVAQASASGSLAGLIVMLPSRSMRVLLNQSGIPTVIEGYVEADLANLCWLSLDQVETGRLLASHLLKNGHRRLATIMRDVWSIGEQLIHDGITEAMVAAGLTADGLLVRSAPVARPAIVELARGLLTQGVDMPTGFICRTVFQADCVSEAVQLAGLVDRVEVVVASSPVRPEASRYTCVTAEIDAEEFGRMAGNMLKCLRDGQTSEPRGRQIAVRLRGVKS